MAQLIRLRCVQGLQYFNLVSDNLLMSFSVSFNLVVFSGMKNMEAVHNSLGIFTSIKSSKIPSLVSVEVEAGPWPKIALLLGCSCLCILSLLWLAIVNICPLRLWEGHGGSSLFPANKDQEIQKGGPAQFQGQATQDGHPRVLCNPLLNQCPLHLCPASGTDLPIHVCLPG